LEKAQRLEQLLLRYAGGEPLEELNATLQFNLDAEAVARQQDKYEQGARTWQALIDGRHGHPHKITSEIREYLYARKEADESLRAPALVIEVQEKFSVSVSAGHVNHLLRKRALTAPVGHPYQRPADEAVPDRQPVENAGLFFPGRGQGGAGGDGGDRERGANGAG
jgi:transposase